MRIRNFGRTLATMEMIEVKRRGPWRKEFQLCRGAGVCAFVGRRHVYGGTQGIGSGACHRWFRIIRAKQKLEFHEQLLALDWCDSGFGWICRLLPGFSSF